VQRDRFSNLWVVPLGGGAPQPIPEIGERLYGVVWTNSGKLISQTDIGGHSDLWSVDLHSRELHQLTDDNYAKQYPAASTDGQYLVYASNRSGAFQIWRSNQDGSKPLPLTSGASAEEAVITPDNKWVVYASMESGFYALWKIPIGGGASTQITRVPTQYPAVSPDGKLIACQYSSDGKTVSITVLQEKDGKVLHSFPDMPMEAPVRWSADGKSLLYVSTNGDASNIWAQPVDGGLPRQLTHYTEGRIFAFALSLDGMYLACIRGRSTSDVVLLEAAK